MTSRQLQMEDFRTVILERFLRSTSMIYRSAVLRNSFPPHEIARRCLLEYSDYPRSPNPATNYTLSPHEPTRSFRASRRLESLDICSSPFQADLIWGPLFDSLIANTSFNRRRMSTFRALKGPIPRLAQLKTQRLFQNQFACTVLGWGAGSTFRTDIFGALRWLLNRERIHCC